MQLQDHPAPLRTTHTVQLPRPSGEPLALVLRPLPLGFHRRLRQRGLVPPAPPTRVARDSAGKPIRDDRGLAVMVENTRDADYVDALELYHQRVAVLVVAEALADDPHVSFDTPVPGDDGDWPAFADALYHEFDQAGFAAGDLVRLCDEVARLSNLLDDHLDAARSSFSPAPPTGAT